jgi:hypothetical protein
MKKISTGAMDRIENFRDHKLTIYEPLRNNHKVVAAVA